SARSLSAVMLTVTNGVPSDASSTVLPAARMISPCGERITPEFCTSGPISHTRPPGPPELVSIVPALLTVPPPRGAAKCIFPFRKPVPDRFRLEAPTPATSILPCAPITTPLGLSRNTRPPTGPPAPMTDCSSPSILLCGIDPLAPTTRFRTAEEFEDCIKRVISLTSMEKLCQLMIVLAVLVIVRVLPELENVALPAPTVPPVGLARVCVADTPKQAATDSAISFGL